mmetsp:Transcript_14943/g.30983  ORF Transcript_14943/g.30983 Transcript_14943/m.30983 type:complete len:98 (-) Transcript_14943:94-387(-)
MHGQSVSMFALVVNTKKRGTDRRTGIFLEGENIHGPNPSRLRDECRVNKTKATEIVAILGREDNFHRTCAVLSTVGVSHITMLYYELCALRFQKLEF